MANALLFTLLALVIAYVLSELFHYFRLPRVIGQLLAGVILSIPYLKDILYTDEIGTAFSYLANIGIILLFFFIGLELNLRGLKRTMRVSAYVAFFNTTIPLITGFLAAHFIFGLDTIVSLIIGISVSVSSQAISLDILDEAKLLRSRIGSIIIASGTVDDIFELLLISGILVTVRSAALGSVDFSTLLLDIFAFIVIVAVFRAFLIPIALRLFEREKSQSGLFMGALIIVLTMAYLSELLGVGSLIGALVAGILMRHTLLKDADLKPWRRNEFSHSLHTISFGFLIPLFFISVGFSMDLNSISGNLPLIAVFIGIAIVGTILGTAIGVLLGKGTLREGFIVGWGVLPKGDTELVIASLALHHQIITVDIYTAIIAVALFCTFVAPIVFKYLVGKDAQAAPLSNRRGRRGVSGSSNPSR